MTLTPDATPRGVPALIADRYVAAVAALAEAIESSAGGAGGVPTDPFDFGAGRPDRLPPIDPAGELRMWPAAWAALLPREHRLLRLPPEVWARLRRAAPRGRRVDEPGSAYDRFVPPAVLAMLDSHDLDDPELRALAAESVEAWLAVQRELSRGTGGQDDFAALSASFGEDAWGAQLDPRDDTAPAQAGGGAGRAVFARGSWLDASARRELEALVSALPGGTQRWGAYAPLILAGVWGGALKLPRLEQEWDSAKASIEAGIEAVSTPAQVAAARVSLLAENSLGALAPDAWMRFVTWAFSRAAGWRTFSSPDPELHTRLVEHWRGARASRMDESTVVGPGAPGRPIWSPWVVDAVTNSRLREQPAETAAPPRPPRPARPAPTTDDLLAELDALEGLVEVKRVVREIVDFHRLETARYQQGRPRQPISQHLVLVGNPGTGKTTVARLVGRILHSMDVLERGTFREVQRSDFVGQGLGETLAKTRALLEGARGGVLFIDEAYALAADRQGADPYADPVINELLAAMENHRADLVIIAAGYPGPMQRFLAANPGLKSRFRGEPLLFADLSNAQLTDVFVRMAQEGAYEVGADVVAAVGAYFARQPRVEGFGNARAARNLYDTARTRLASRHALDPSGVASDSFSVADIPAPPTAGQVDEVRFETAMAAIRGLIGQHRVKEQIEQLAQTARLARERAVRGVAVAPPQVGHMAFVGPPGTGKTTVAHQLGEVFASLGMLRSGHVVPVNRGTLVAEFIGQTAPKVKAAVRDALDGILLIDEAYALVPPGDGYRDFGHEALATLIEEMENNRGRLVVIMAGYSEQMGRLLSANPGLASRVGTTVEFKSFEAAELREIADAMATGLSLVLDPEAADRIVAAAEGQRRNPSFANARTVRNLLEEAVRRQAVRLGRRMSVASTDELNRIVAEDVVLPRHAPPTDAGMYL